MINKIANFFKNRKKKSNNTLYLNGIGYVFQKRYVENDSLSDISIELEEKILSERAVTSKQNPYLEGMALAVTILINLEERCKRKEEKLNAIRFLSEPTDEIQEIK